MDNLQEQIKQDEVEIEKIKRKKTAAERDAEKLEMLEKKKEKIRIQEQKLKMAQRKREVAQAKAKKKQETHHKVVLGGIVIKNIRDMTDQDREVLEISEEELQEIFDFYYDNLKIFVNKYGDDYKFFMKYSFEFSEAQMDYNGNDYLGKYILKRHHR